MLKRKTGSVFQGESRTNAVQYDSCLIYRIGSVDSLHKIVYRQFSLSVSVAAQNKVSAGPLTESVCSCCQNMNRQTQQINSSQPYSDI